MMSLCLNLCKLIFLLFQLDGVVNIKMLKLNVIIKSRIYILNLENNSLSKIDIIKNFYIY